MSNQKISIEEIRKVHKRLLLGETKASLNKEYKVHASYFSRWFHKLGLEIPRGAPRCNINATYFDVIDSEDKAYLLGILFTDGYIKRPSHKFKHQTVIGLEVEQTDKKLIEYLNYKIKPQGTCMKIICNNYGLTKKGVIPIHYRTTIYSDYLANCLINNYNFCYSKSNNINISLPFNKIKGFEFAFIRGLIDGDGSIFKIKTLNNGDQVFGISFISCSMNACNDLNNFLLSINKNLKGNITIKTFENEYQNIYSLKYIRREDVLWLADQMYNNCEFCLIRKFDRLKKLCITTLNSKHKYESFVYETVNRVLTKQVMLFSSAENRN